MKVTPTAIPEVLLIEPEIFGDNRGFFFESFNQREWVRQTGFAAPFVQDNQSHSRSNVLRGLHYQVSMPQGKLVRVVAGEVFDVAVDIRRGSPTFGKWVSTVLSAANRRMLWIPAGFAHGFLALSDADYLYKATAYYAPEHERTIAWNDPDLAIDWPCTAPILSARDNAAPRLRDAELP
jgi:dTDP-4-dehydrorhamnose 3,5-epimerase